MAKIDIEKILNECINDGTLSKEQIDTLILPKIKKIKKLTPLQKEALCTEMAQGFSIDEAIKIVKKK